MQWELENEIKQTLVGLTPLYGITLCLPLWTQAIVAYSVFEKKELSTNSCTVYVNFTNQGFTKKNLSKQITQSVGVSLNSQNLLANCIRKKRI